MHTQTAIYRSLRLAHPNLPAQSAWREARKTIEIERWARDTGFPIHSWDEDSRYARWHEQGYVLEAIIECDEAGWDMDGADTIGRFTDRWAPGAIEHDRFNTRICQWFIPACAENAHVLYRRACAYGHDWTYLSVTVTAMRDGIKLGVGSLFGIESDSDDDYLAEIAFALTGEAISEANRSLDTLCAGHKACT